MGGALTALAPDFDHARARRARHELLDPAAAAASTSTTTRLPRSALRQLPGRARAAAAALADPDALGPRRGERLRAPHHDDRCRTRRRTSAPARRARRPPGRELTAEIEARTIGAELLGPAVDPGRYWSNSGDVRFELPFVSSVPVLDGLRPRLLGRRPVGVPGRRPGGGSAPTCRRSRTSPRARRKATERIRTSYPRLDPDAQQQMVADFLQPNGASGASDGPLRHRAPLLLQRLLRPLSGVL